jgi:hypothetical protein
MIEATPVVEEAIPRTAIQISSAMSKTLACPRWCWRWKSGAMRARQGSAADQDGGRSRQRLLLLCGARDGRVDLDTVNPSWLIFSDGFSAGRAFPALPSAASTFAQPDPAGR